jgi:hypothetical protein
MAYNQINDGVNGFGFEIVCGPGSDDAMGRPPLGMKPTTVRLSAETIGRIEALVGNRRLAVFVREAVQNELERREASDPKGR